MQSKSFLIAIAAFAVTATGVHAYGGNKMLQRAGLSKDQVNAVEQAQALRAAGDVTAARDTLATAGITEDTLRSLHTTAEQTRSAAHEALAAGDYETFKAAVADSPLADLITTEADFDQFRAAHEFRHASDRQKVRVGQRDLQQKPAKQSVRSPFLSELSDEQRDALRVARQANDRATIQAIFDEAGIEVGSR